MYQLDQFTKELHEWSLNGTEPSLASRDLRYYLSLQEKRLESTGISREEEFIHVKDEISGCRDRTANGYTSKILYREAKQLITYRKNGKKIRKIKRPVYLYVSLVDKEGFADRSCTCPNCGHTMTLSKAQNGCPYCGTHFETDDVYPCVSSYYTVPGIAERASLIDNIKNEMIIAGIIFGTAAAILYFFTWNDMDLRLRVPAVLFTSVFAGFITAFVWYMLRSFLLFVKVLWEAGREIPMLKGLHSRKKMMNFMQAYDPDFSYEAFEGRVLSLLRTIAFSGERETLSIWAGERDLSVFDKITDMQYRGAVSIKKCSKNDHLLCVEGTAFLTNTYVSKSVLKKDEKIQFVLEKEAVGNTDPGFSIHKVSCPSCGGSFDAMHRKHCPYCGNSYDLRKKDWIVKDMRLK